MDRNASDIGPFIDHTILNKGYSKQDLDTVIQEAQMYDMNLCVPPNSVEYVRDEFDGGISTVIGFPLGYNQTEVKVFEAERAVENGADELDLACNVSNILQGDWGALMEEMQAFDSFDQNLKVIIETGLLTTEQIRETSKRLGELNSVDFIKTCTGFVEGHATIEDVKTINENCGEDTKVKASGGIGSYSEVRRFFEVGADRIGASSGDKIMKDYLER